MKERVPAPPPIGGEATGEIEEGDRGDGVGGSGGSGGCKN